MFIVNLCPTGMIPTKEMTPHVPITPHDIAEDVRATRPTMVHIHARDDDGFPTFLKETYARIIGAIRNIDEDVIICVSTSGRLWSDFAKRSECLELKGGLKPDMASLTLSSLNFNRQASVNEPQMIQDLAQKMLDNGIKPELEVFDTGMVNYARYLIVKKLIVPPYYFNIIMGNVACAQAHPLPFGTIISSLPENSTWSAGGVGDYQLKANLMGLIAGGGVRIGIEDNIYWKPDRMMLATNPLLVYRIRELAAQMGLQEATVKEARWALLSSE